MISHSSLASGVGLSILNSTMRARGGLDGVHDVVERGREGVDVFGIDRSQKRLVQAPDSTMGDPVALVFEVFQLFPRLLRMIVMIEHFLESLGAGECVLRRLLEKVEKLFFVGNEVKQASRPFA